MGDHGERGDTDAKARTRAGRPALPPEERGEARHVTMPPRLVAAAEAWGRANGVRRRSPAIVALAAQGVRIMDGIASGGGRVVEVEMVDDGQRRKSVSLIIAPVIGRQIEAVALRGGLSFSGAVSALVALALGFGGGGAKGAGRGGAKP